jgi:hypothetical protein
MIDHRFLKTFTCSLSEIKKKKKKRRREGRKRDVYPALLPSLITYTICSFYPRSLLSLGCPVGWVLLTVLRIHLCIAG